MTVNNLTLNIRQIIVGVNFLTRNKYIYGQRSHRTNIKGLQ
jgi:hypothetical protein